MNDAIGGLLALAVLLTVGGFALTRRNRRKTQEEDRMMPDDKPQPCGRVFISCTLKGMTLRGLAMQNEDLIVADARALVLRGVMSGPEFLDEGDESDRYRAEYFRRTVLETLGIEEPTAQKVIRPWEADATSGIGDRIVFFSIDRSSGEVNLRLITMVPSTFIG